jgi:hypothetical protein
MNYEFPNQNIPESQKDNVEFHMKHIYAFIHNTTTSHYTQRTKDILELSYAIVAKASPKSRQIIESTLTKQYGDDLQVPFVIYPLIEQKLEDAIGYYRLRPLRSKTAVINKTAVNSKLQEIMIRITEAAERHINSEAEAEIMSDTGKQVELGSTNPDLEVPDLDKIDDFIANYRTEVERIGETVLDYILNAKGEKEKIYLAAEFFLAFGDCALFIDEKNGNPSLYVPHPLEYFCDELPTENINSDVEICALDQWFSENEILNKFDLLESERKKLSDLFRGDTEEFRISEDLGLSKQDFIRNTNGVKKCRVVTVYWKSRRKLEYKEFENKKTKKKGAFKIDGRIKERDKKRLIDNEELDVIDVENIRHITMVGPELVLSWGVLKNQITSVGDPRKRFIPFVRIKSDNAMRTGEVRSMAKKLLFLQEFASEILWELRFSIRQIDGNVLMYDTSMFPKELFGDFNRRGNSANKAMDKIMRLLKKERIMLVNTKDKRSNGYANSINVSQKGRMSDLMQMFALIEQMADKICGIPSQKANQVYQKATVAELQAQNTTSRLEEYFGIFESGLEKALNYLTAKGQQLYKKNDILSFIGGDGAQKFIEITEDWANDDLGVKFVNNRKDYESKNNIDQMATRIMSTTDKIEVMIAMLDVLDSENYEEAKGLLLRYQKQAAEEAQVAQQAMQEQAKAAQEAQQAEIQNENEQKALDRQNNIDVAMINHNSKAELESMKIKNENYRKAADIETKNREIDLKEQSENNKV